MSFNEAQVAQLLKPIAKQRVLQDGKGHSHVSQQDVTAHLIRMFGFGNFDTKVLAAECVFEQERTDPKTGKPTGRFDVCYRALLRLTVRDEHGQQIAEYEDGSTATAQNQNRGDAHDLAYKSAISLAKKRCAINLGDQFGLSLYNKGQTSALVIKTLVDGEHDGQDVQADVPQQVALGNDETDYETGVPEPPVDPEYDHWAAIESERLEQLIAGATTSAELTEIASQIAASELHGDRRDALRQAFSARSREIAA